MYITTSAPLCSAHINTNTRHNHLTGPRILFLIIAATHHFQSYPSLLPPLSVWLPRASSPLMTDPEQAGDGNAATTSSQAAKWDRTQNTYFYTSLSSILADSDAATITDSELRTKLAESMQEKFNIIIDSKYIAARIAAATRYAEDWAEQSVTYEELHRRWEERRDHFTAEQTERRRVRAERASRRRRPQPVVHSDEEFDMEEPQLPQSALQQAKVAAHRAYETVRGRFEAERRQQRQARTEACREERNRQRRDQRRSELLSSVLNDQDDHSENGSNDSSSSSSCPSPAKKTFSAAAVIGVYTQYICVKDSNRS
jgi:hypothetical protein